MSDTIVYTDSLKCPYVKKSIATCPFIGKHVALCPELKDKVTDIAPSEDVDLQSFYKDAFQCPYVKQSLQTCPFLQSQVNSCPYLSTNSSNSSSDNLNQSTKEDLVPLSLQVNEQGLLIPDFPSKEELKKKKETS